MVGNWAGLIIAIEDKHSSASSGRLSAPRGIFGHLGFYIFLFRERACQGSEVQGEHVGNAVECLCHRKGHALL